MVGAALEDVGLAYATEQYIDDHLTSGRLIRVIDDWYPPYSGFFLYYPSRRQPPFVLPITPALFLGPFLFRPQARSRAVRLQAGRIDHGRFLFGTFGGKPLQHPGKAPHVTPSLPTVAEGLRRPILPRRIAPTQVIAIYEDYPDRNPPFIDPQLFGTNGFNRSIWFGGKTVHWTVSDPPHAASQKSLLINTPVSPGAWITQAKPHQAD